MSSAADVKPLHQAFSWIADGAADVNGAEFVALTMDVCRGVQICLQLIHSTDMRTDSGAGDDDPPPIGTVEKERLLLMATAAMGMLGKQADDRIESINAQVYKSRQAEKGNT
jgi:hypothetical protein